jgi:hypothetical protein
MELPLTPIDVLALALVVGTTVGAGSALRWWVNRFRRPVPPAAASSREPDMDVEAPSTDRLLVAKLVKEPEIQVLVPVRERIDHPLGSGRVAVLWLDPDAHGVHREVAERLRDMATLVRADPSCDDLDDRLRRQRSQCIYN